MGELFFFLSLEAHEGLAVEHLYKRLVKSLWVAEQRGQVRLDEPF